MPRISGLLTEREKQICGRVREIRTRAALSQQEFANVLGLTRPQVAALEMPWTPLRYGVADRMCEQLNVSQQWLATGTNPVAGYIRIYPEIAVEISPRELFSHAWDRRISHFVASAIKELEEKKRILATVPDAADKIRKDYLYNLAERWFTMFPPHLHEALYNAIVAAVIELYHQHQKDIPLGIFRPQVQKEQKISVDEVQSFEHGGVVKTEISLKELLKKVKLATKPRGMKAALAAHMGVPRSAVSQWLSGSIEPGGKMTLRLLNWVNDPKR